MLNWNVICSGSVERTSVRNFGSILPSNVASIVFEEEGSDLDQKFG